MKDDDAAKAKKVRKREAWRAKRGLEKADPEVAKRRKVDAEVAAAEAVKAAALKVKTDAEAVKIGEAKQLRNVANLADAEVMDVEKRRKAGKLAPADAKSLMKAAKQAAVWAAAAAAAAEAKLEVHPAEAEAAEAAAEAEAKLEAKRLRKAAKLAAAEAETAEAETAEADAAEAKRLRKAAKRAAAEAAVAAEEKPNVDLEKSKGMKKLEAKEIAADKDPQRSGDELTVFVGGLDFRCEEQTIWEDFGVCGEIEKMSMPLNGEGRSSGTAFITFKTSDGVEGALKYNGDDYGGRTLTVRVAGKVGERGLSRGDEALEVCVRGLPNDIPDATMRDSFYPCGEIASLRVPRWPDGGAKGMAFITFVTAEGLAKALELNLTIKMGDRHLSVEKASQGKGGKSKGSGKSK